MTAPTPTSTERDFDPMPERSALARDLAYDLYGWTDEEFCDEQDPASDFDRVDFLQMADTALRYFERTRAAHDADLVQRARQESFEAVHRFMREELEEHKGSDWSDEFTDAFKAGMQTAAAIAREGGTR